MSWNGANWARKVRCGGPGPKGVLVELGLLSDEDGIAFPSLGYLAEATEQSKDTVRRQLKALEAAGVLVAFKREDATGRQRSNEYRLMLDRKPESFAVVREERGAGENESANAPENAGEGSTLPPSPDAAEGLQAVQGGGSHQMPPLESKPDKNYPLTPSEPDRDGPTFEAFARVFPIPVVGDLPAQRLFEALSVQERSEAVAAAEGYAGLTRRLKVRPKTASHFLKNRMFTDQKLRPQPKPQTAFVLEGSPQWRAWLVVATCCGRAGIPTANGPGGRGWNFPTEWPAFGRDVPLPHEVPWVFVRQGSQNFAAWMGKLAEAAPESWGSRIGLQSRGPDRGLLVPAEWPPRKDGTFAPSENEGVERVRAADEGYFDQGGALA